SVHQRFSRGPRASLRRLLPLRNHGSPRLRSGSESAVSCNFSNAELFDCCILDYRFGFAELSITDFGLQICEIGSACHPERSEGSVPLRPDAVLARRSLCTGASDVQSAI